MLTPDETDAIQHQMFAPWIKAMGLRTIKVDENGADFLLPENRDLVHGGGVICGQALMAAADTASVLALSAVNGEFRMVTTVDLTAHFIRPAPPADVALRIQIESNGKRMAFVRAEMRPATGGKLVATATAAFMYLA